MTSMTCDDEGADVVGVLAEDPAWIDVCVGVSDWQTPDRKLHFMEKDYRVKGEVWRVHKSGADPCPSSPHAHCIAGAQRFIGCTLHFGTAELYRKRQALGRCLEESQFNRLIELIRPKFPGLTLPLPT